MASCWLIVHWIPSQGSWRLLHQPFWRLENRSELKFVKYSSMAAGGCSRVVAMWRCSILRRWRLDPGRHGEEEVSCRMQSLEVRSRVRGGKCKHRVKHTGYGKRRKGKAIKMIKAAKRSSVKKCGNCNAFWMAKEASLRKTFQSETE